MDHPLDSAQLYLKDRPRRPSIGRDAHNNKPTSFCRRRRRRRRQFRLGPPIERSGISKSRGGEGGVFLRPISLSLSLRLRPSHAMRAKDNGGSFRRLFAPFRRFSPPSLPPRISIRLRPPPSVRPSQMKSVDQNQMAADAVCCREVVMRAVQCSGVSGRIYSYNAIDPPLPFCSAVASIHPSP